MRGDFPKEQSQYLLVLGRKKPRHPCLGQGRGRDPRMSRRHVTCLGPVFQTPSHFLPTLHSGTSGVAGRGSHTCGIRVAGQPGMVPTTERSERALGDPESQRKRGTENGAIDREGGQGETQREYKQSQSWGCKGESSTTGPQSSLAPLSLCLWLALLVCQRALGGVVLWRALPLHPSLPERERPKTDQHHVPCRDVWAIER